MCKAILLESMRLKPVVSNVPRQASKDIEICGQLIPKGTAIFINLLAAHYNSKVFPDPEIFRAERFLEDRDTAFAYSYLPFIAGPRNCIGQKLALQEAIITLAAIMQQFNIELFNEKEKITFTARLTLHADNLNLKFIKRK